MKCSDLVGEKETTFSPFRIPVRNIQYVVQSATLQTPGSGPASAASAAHIGRISALEQSGLQFSSLENKEVGWLGKWIPEQAVPVNHLGCSVNTDSWTHSYSHSDWGR